MPCAWVQAGSVQKGPPRAAANLAPLPLLQPEPRLQRLAGPCALLERVHREAPGARECCAWQPGVVQARQAALRVEGGRSPEHGHV